METKAVFISKVKDMRELEPELTPNRFHRHLVAGCIIGFKPLSHKFIMGLTRKRKEKHRNAMYFWTDFYFFRPKTLNQSFGYKQFLQQYCR